MTVAEIKQLVGPNFADNFHQEVNSVIAPLRKYIEQGRPASMGKEIWEYLVTDSIEGAEWCGAGKGIADVRIGKNIAIDVKSLQTDGLKTSEASLHQTFKETTAEYFKTQDKYALWKLFVNGWLAKVNSVKEYYLLGIIRNKETLACSLVGFKVQDQTPYLSKSCKFLKESMKIDSIVDPNYAQIKIYKGKTRMEITFKQGVFGDPAYNFPIYKGIK
jgi:hypothetical protein